MNIHLGTRLLHLSFLMGWMTTVFGVPVLLLSMADPVMESAVRPRSTEAVQDDSHED